MTSPGPSGATPAKPKSTWADLGPRIVSAVVIVAVIATGLYFGGYIFAGLAAIVFGITYREWEQDTAAFALARDNGLPILVYALDDKEGLMGVLSGKTRSTFVGLEKKQE